MTPKQQRQDVRVQDYVRLRVIPIDEASRQAVLDQIAVERLNSEQEDMVYHSARMARDVREHQDLPNTQMVNMMQSLHAKMDAILMYLMERDVEEKWGAQMPVDISASGIRFASDEPYEINQILRLEIMLRIAPPRPIFTLAEVVRIDDGDPGWRTEKAHRIATRYIDLDDNDRDRIVKRIFDVQRMLLRRHRQDKDKQVS